jgi:hypothetical protein
VVIELLLPSALSDTLQHTGRAGRNGNPARAIVLAEQSAFQVLGAKNLPKVPQKAPVVKTEPTVVDLDLGNNTSGDSDLPQDISIAPGDDSTTRYRRVIEVGLRQFILADDCRRVATDVYFNNPSPRQRTQPFH